MCVLCISEYVEVCTCKYLYVLHYMYCVVYLCAYVLYLLGVLLSIYYVFTLFEYIKHIILSLIANKPNQSELFLKFIYCPLKSGYRCDRNSMSIVVPNIPLYKYALESFCRLLSFLDH